MKFEMEIFRALLISHKAAVKKTSEIMELLILWSRDCKTPQPLLEPIREMGNTS